MQKNVVRFHEIDVQVKEGVMRKTTKVAKDYPVSEDLLQNRLPMQELAGEITEHKGNTQYFFDGRQQVAARADSKRHDLETIISNRQPVGGRWVSKVSTEGGKMMSRGSDRKKFDSSQLGGEIVLFGVPEPMTIGSSDNSQGTKNAAQCEWSVNAVSLLLNSYGKKYASGRGYLRNKDWEAVVSTVNARSEDLENTKTMKQCRDKVDSLKRRYKLEKRKTSASPCDVSSWPFFKTLDEIFSYQPEVVGIPGGVDAGVKLPSDKQAKPCRFVDRLGNLNSREECGGDYASHNPPYRDSLQKGKMEDIDGLSEDGFNLPNYRQRKLLNNMGNQESSDKGSRSRRASSIPGVSGKGTSMKRKAKAPNPVQPLANVGVGFSEVFAEIEMTKIEILTKMKLEMAKLEKRTRKRRDASSTSSESE